MIGPAVTALAAAGPAAPEAGPPGRGPPCGPVPGCAAFGSIRDPEAPDALVEAVDDDEAEVPALASEADDAAPTVTGSGLAPAVRAAGPVDGFALSAPVAGWPASDFGSIGPGLAVTTGSVADLGGIPGADPCGPFAPPAAVEEVEADALADVLADVEAVDADVVAGRDAPPGGLDGPGLPGAASGFRPPGPGLSASLGGGVTGKSSNSTASPRPPSTAAAPGARARYGGPASLSPRG
jgi:hypothetical protein